MHEIIQLMSAYQEAREKEKKKILNKIEKLIKGE